MNNNSSFKTGYGAVKEPTCGWFAGAMQECNKYGTTNDITKSWNTEVGYKASTTGNISGIYDMSGGAWDYVMGVMMNQYGELCSGEGPTFHSGFNGPFCNKSGHLTTGVDFPASKYYDVYNYNSNFEDYHKRILGDATGELGPFSFRKYNSSERRVSSWYEDEAWYITHVDPWFTRGSDRAAGTFSQYIGHVMKYEGFRIVLTPQETSIE